MVHTQGVRGLYNGLTASLSRQVSEAIGTPPQLQRPYRGQLEIECFVNTCVKEWWLPNVWYSGTHGCTL